MVLDGGLATHLEAGGADLSGPLWSARVLQSAPATVRAAHEDFFAAGADIATTCTYQLSGMSLRAAGSDPADLPVLTTRAVDLAVLARDAINPDGLIAGSVGPYGACRADGSEYTGDYGLGTGAARVLRDFHVPRLEALLTAEVDVLAGETVPRLDEALVILDVVASLGAAIPVWLSFSVSAGGLRTAAGDPLRMVAQELAGAEGLVAVGVNCCDPADVLPAWDELRCGATDLPLIAYPNSGERWDAAANGWAGDPGWPADLLAGWWDRRPAVLGGCCRTGPRRVAELAAARNER
ncbi:MAG: homocysteine S-methyltransferase [Micrococcales bacterium]|nr:MAG: homocysteine S-methyltransferase [Micrococcales bacterium]